MDLLKILIRREYGVTNKKYTINISAVVIAVAITLANFIHAKYKYLMVVGINNETNENRSAAYKK
jgi:hypothetical protein